MVDKSGEYVQSVVQEIITFVQGCLLVIKQLTSAYTLRST